MVHGVARIAMMRLVELGMVCGEVGFLTFLVKAALQTATLRPDIASAIRTICITLNADWGKGLRHICFGPFCRCNELGGPSALGWTLLSAIKIILSGTHAFRRKRDGRRPERRLPI